MNGELPQGWTQTTIGAVADDISYGFTAKAASNVKGPRYLRITDIQNNTVDWASVPSCSIPAERVPAYQLRSGDVVFARTGATTGKSFLIKSCPQTVFASYLIRVRPATSVVPEFVARFFQSASYWNQISENISGSAQPNCNATKLSSLVLPIPPIAEQQRIVTKLEMLLNHVDACRRRLARVPALLKRFRQSVLAAACTGRLTADWREDDTYEDDLPAGWRWMPLEQLLPRGGIFDGPFGSNLKSSDYTESGVRVIRLENIGQLRFIGEKETFVSREKYKTLERHAVGQGDIIFASFISEEVRACVLPKLSTKAIAKADCFCLRPNATLINNNFLAFQLVSQESYDALFEEIHGATRPRINTTQLRKLEVRVCPLPEQQEIVSRVEKLFALADRLEARFVEGRKRVDSITQAILAKAFRGDLVPTEAELAKAEGRSFESAEELLERIKPNGDLSREKAKRRRRKRQ
jgi:type I restriction enzyme, S subunit